MVCGSCSAAVPSGRLSCASCGDLVASVVERELATIATSSSTQAPASDGGTAFQGPGSYVPPAIPGQLAGSPAPARAWAGHHEPRPGRRDAAASGADAADADADADARRLTEFVGWLAVAGAALAAVGFLLPWSNVAVIGSSGVGYFDRWGLAGPAHILVVVGLLIVLVLAVVPNRVPTWIRVGLPGVALAALLFGLAWPYLLGPLGGAAGVLCVTLGALLLLIAGIVALATDRHRSLDQAV